MTLCSYIDSIRDKSVAVIGIGVSNTPLIKKLLSEHIDVTACDKRTFESLGDLGTELKDLGCKFQLGENYLDGICQDIIFRTPGLRPDVPQILSAVQKGSILTSEMEVFFEVCPCPIIAVTGSDGKTTTTTVISELLKASGKKVYVGGNIGNPLLCTADEMSKEDIAVLELSSFQLLTMKCSPHIAVITNISPNHLDMHHGMEEYIAAKENVFLHQKPGDIAVFNEDNAITKEESTRTVGSALTFSRQKEVENGVFLRGDEIVLRKNGTERTIMTTEDIKIPGTHNIENYMAAIAAVDGLVSDETILHVARNFGGVEHRIELVRTLKDVRYYNDSIASSPTRTIAGLKSFKEKVILIAGGYDKHIPFDVLGPEVCEHVKVLVLCGATEAKIEEAVRNAPNYKEGCPVIIHAAPFENAVNTAKANAEEGDIVILSPACASFDQFKNFMIRGNTFKDIVNQWED